MRLPCCRIIHAVALAALNVALWHIRFAALANQCKTMASTTMTLLHTPDVLPCSYLASKSLTVIIRVGKDIGLPGAKGSGQTNKVQLACASRLQNEKREYTLPLK